MINAKDLIEINDVVIRFAGDSGDGIQLIGNEFSLATSLMQNDLATFPDFPAEIRAPVGTLPGVSGFQIHFGSHEIHTPGDDCDVLVVMNAAALKKNIGNLKKGGIIVANEDGFDSRNLRLAGYTDEANPLDSPIVEGYKLYRIPITKLIREGLKSLGLGTKEQDRSKNMFVLGLICWMYDRSIDPIMDFIEKKFAKHPQIHDANVRALRIGHNYGETAEIFVNRFEVKPAPMKPGTYRGITGNQAVAYGLIAASVKSGIPLFYGSYPITPASDILHELAKLKNFGAITFQAEDEIAAISSAIGASYGGSIGVTASSGPGIDLKSEAMGLALMLELPLVIIDVQRAGPSTGMPTKTEQSDLLLAMFGRHGEAPVPVIAAQSPADCFDTIYEATRIAIEHMTPVIFLSDGFLSSSTEPWKFPVSEKLNPIHPRFALPQMDGDQKYQPYKRDEKLVRDWALPGLHGYENRIGGIEKEDITGNISYDPINHEKMVAIRAQKVANIADYIPKQQLDSGSEKGKILVLGWGSTYGTIKTVCDALRTEGIELSHAQLRYINPFPANLEELLSGFEHVLIPENNSGQLAMLIRSKYMINTISLNKIQGLPFTVSEITDKIKSILNNGK